MLTEEKQHTLNETLGEVAEQIKHLQETIISYTSHGNFSEARDAIDEVIKLEATANELRIRIQSEQITSEDVDILRSIRPARKSIQNMLEPEVAQTTKFEKLLGNEMRQKSAYEMRNSNNAWREDLSTTVPVIEINKISMPKSLTEFRKDTSINRGIFFNNDTGIRITFSGKSVDEIIAKAIPDNKRGIPIEARIASLYKIQALIENAICFDSTIYTPKNNANSHSLFMHRMYGVIKYDNDFYLIKLSIEELYSTDKENNFRNTQNRLYTFSDIKTTPMKLLGDQAHSSPQIANTDASLGANISIPQLYALVKQYDHNYYENPSASGRAERVTELQMLSDYQKAVEEVIAETISEHGKENTAATDAAEDIEQAYEDDFEMEV